MRNETPVGRRTQTIPVVAMLVPMSAACLGNVVRADTRPSTVVTQFRHQKFTFIPSS